MRPTGTGVLARLLAPSRVHAHRLEVEGPTGAWIDVTRWWRAMSWGEDVDAGAASGTLTLRREARNPDGTLVSLAPLMSASPLNVGAGGSYAPLLRSFRRVRISSGVGAPDAAGTRPTPDVVVFRGVIDDPQWGGKGSRIELSVRDLAAPLLDALITTERTYGSESGTPIATVLQQILTDNGFTDPGDGSLTVRVLGDPEGWSLRPFTQARGGNVWDALRTLALQMGWDFRYWWHTDGVYAPTLVEPKRDTTTADLVLTAAQFTDIPRLSLNGTNVRNDGELIYTDRATGQQATVYAQDAASILAYGRRSFGLSEDAASNIDTAAEAQQLLDAVVADLGTPYVEQEAVLPYLWPVQLGDVLEFPGTTPLYDDPQRLAVSAYRHELTPETAKTTASLRGRPIGAFRRWLALLGYDALIEPVPDAADVALTNIQVTDGEGTRTWTWTRGLKVAFIRVYDRLEAVPVADPWPTDSDLDALTLRDADTYTTTKPPQGFQRFVLLAPYYATKSGGYLRAPVVKIIVDPDPVALAASLKAIVHGDTADLVLTVTGGATDFPVVVDVLEESPDAVPLASFTFTGPGTRTLTDAPALGNRPLPLRALRHWYVRLTTTAGEVRWGAPATADRDALPQVEVSVRDWTATASLRIDYDDDTDSVRLTLLSGKTKTWSGLTGSGALVYVVGSTVLDDSTTEAPLATGETRQGYVVAATGGGVTQTFWSGSLHGRPAQPPIVRPRAVKTASGTAEDVYALVESVAASERIGLRVRDGEGDTAPVYTLVQGASDPTPRYVASGTELGPTDWFVTGANPPVQKLAAFALTLDQIRRIALQAVGESSGVAGPWVPLALSLLEQPYLDGLAATWDPVTQRLRVRLQGGPRCASAWVEVDDDPTFGSPMTQAVTLAPGGDVTATFTLSGANRGRVWHARGTPHSGAGLTGLAGTALADAVLVPAGWTADVDTPNNDTARVTVLDPGGEVDPALRVKFYTTVGNGLRTLRNPSSAPSAGTTGGMYTLVIVQDPKHSTVVEPLLYLLDGSVVPLPPVTLDADVAANLRADVAYAGATATITANLDSDAAIGAGNFEMSLNGGTTWTPYAVPSNRVVQVFVAMSTTAKQTALLRAKNGQGEYGPTTTIEVSRYDTAASGPTLTVVETPGSLASSISYAYTGSVTYQVNGVATTLPASPFAVNRPAAGGTALVLTFTATLSGQAVSESVTILPVDSDTVSPDVQLVPVATTSTYLAFLAYAMNPKTGGYVNASFTFTDCSGNVGGTIIGSGSTYTALANGLSVIAVRPGIGVPPGTIRMRATLTGGGASEITRTISESTKDFTPPVFEPTSSSTATTVTASWSAPSAGITVWAKTDSGAWSVQYDGSSAFNTAYTVSRNAPGGSVRTLWVKAVNTATGAETVRQFPVPAQEATGGGGTSYAFTSLATLPVNFAADTITLSWSGTFPPGATFRIYVNSSNRNYWNDQPTTTSSTSYVFTTDENIVSGGGNTVTYRFYVSCEYNGTEVARSAVQSRPVTY